MATGTNGIATVANCVSKGCTQSGFSDTTQCPTYGDFTGCPTYTTTAVTVSSKVFVSSTTSSTTFVSKITASLNTALPFNVYLQYSALNASNATVTAKFTITAGNTSATLDTPFGTTTQMYQYSLTAAPKISLDKDVTPTATSASKNYVYTVSKSLTTK